MGRAGIKRRCVGLLEGVVESRTFLWVWFLAWVLLTGWSFALAASAGSGLASVFMVSVAAALVALHLSVRTGRVQARGEADRKLASDLRQQLKHLRAQFDPHMLFNSLGAVQALMSVDKAAAAELLQHLCGYLRAATCDRPGGCSTLRDEFDRLEHYLEIMKVRMGARLDFDLALPPELAGVQVPRLLLQPLAENAVRHGLEPKAGAVCVEISGAREGGAVVLRIRDTGVGIGPTVEHERDGSGLSLVRGQLRSAYGAQATLTVVPASDADGGTCAEVRLPEALGRLLAA